MSDEKNKIDETDIEKLIPNINDHKHEDRKKIIDSIYRKQLSVSYGMPLGKDRYNNGE